MTVTYEEIIICPSCESEYTVTYIKDKLAENLSFCSCCGEELLPGEDSEEYIDGAFNEDG